MADNVTLSAGTADGAVVATDDITSVHYPINKLAYGALDSATLVSGTNGLPVAQQGTWNVTVNAAIAAGDNNIGNVDVVTLPAITLAAAQTLATVTTVSTVTAVTDITNPVVVNGGVGQTADIKVTLDSETVAIASIAAGDNNIGNVDIVSLPAGNVGQQAMAASLSVVPASNITDATYIGDIKFGEAIPAGTAAIGKLLPPDIDVTAHTNYAKKYYTSAGAATDGIIWSPGAGKRWHVVSLYINVSAAATVTLEDDLAGGDSAVWKGELAANSGVVINFGDMYPLASGEDAADLIITTTAGNVYVTVVGYEI